MDLLNFFILLVIAGAIIWILKKNSSPSPKRGLEKKLDDIPDFKNERHYFSNDSNTGIAVDTKNKKVCLIGGSQKKPDLRILTYRDILSAELFEDGDTINSTVRTSQLGGALVGGVLFGGAGAIIGGLSGKKKSSQKVGRIELRIAVNDTDSPIHDIVFLATKTKKGGMIYSAIMDKARHWHKTVEVLIHQADAEDKAQEKNIDRVEVKTNQVTSMADELKKLADLRDGNVITESEFQAYKTKLLEK